MTISIKPTASGSTIEQDGSTVLSVESDRSVDIDSGTLHVDATNNRVGIGTSSPSYPLHVVTSDAVAGKIQANRSGGFAYFDIQNTSTTVAGSAAITRLITQNAAGTGTTSTDIYRIATGQFSINNNETNSAAFTSFGVGGTERMRIDSGGYVFFGGTTTTQDDHAHFEPNGVLVIDRAAANGRTGIAFVNGSTNCGNIILNLASTQYLTSSDYRLKENVAPMSDSIDRLKQLKPSTWSWTQDGSHGEGFIAHEAQTVVPEAVHGTKDAMRTEEYEVTPAVLDDDGNVVTEAVMGTREVPDYQGIDQSKLVPLLTAALQEAITKIEDLETRIQTLESA